MSCTQEPDDQFDQRFLDEVDPERKLPEAERQRRAEHARKAYFTALALSQQGHEDVGSDLKMQGS
jgi:hypothetical protein